MSGIFQFVVYCPINKKASEIVDRVDASFVSGSSDYDLVLALGCSFVCCETWLNSILLYPHAVIAIVLLFTESLEISSL